MRRRIHERDAAAQGRGSGFVIDSAAGVGHVAVKRDRVVCSVDNNGSALLINSAALQTDVAFKRSSVDVKRIAFKEDSAAHSGVSHVVSKSIVGGKYDRTSAGAYRARARSAFLARQYLFIAYVDVVFGFKRHPCVHEVDSPAVSVRRVVCKRRVFQLGHAVGLRNRPASVVREVIAKIRV